MDIIQELLHGVHIPRMVRVHQKFDNEKVGDISGVLQHELKKPAIIGQVKPGMRIAIAVGSRGVAEIATITKEVVKYLQAQSATPFVVPAMGSHGGATAPGQTEVLRNLGVTEESVGCPIVSSMEVVEIGRLSKGLPVYVDKHAYGADGIVIINRVKPHTAFRGANESGLVKMITIGLGKQKGAESCHAYGFQHMASHIVLMTEIALARLPILFGVATVENAYDQVAKIVAVPAAEIVAEDKRLLGEAKSRMARICFSAIDALIIDRIGKDISGDGMDPNITGRYPTPYATGGPKVSKMAVLDLPNGPTGTLTAWVQPILPHGSL